MRQGPAGTSYRNGSGRGTPAVEGSEWKAIREPSDEYCGEAFRPGDAISRLHRVVALF